MSLIEKAIDQSAIASGRAVTGLSRKRIVESKVSWNRFEHDAP